MCEKRTINPRPAIGPAYDLAFVRFRADGSGGLRQLARCPSLYRLAEQQGTDEPERRVDPIACRAKRNGNMPHGREQRRRGGGGTRSASAMPTAMAAEAHGTIPGSRRRAASGPTRSGFMTCWAMSGSGPTIAGTKVMPVLPATAARGPAATAASASCVAARGAISRSSSVRPPAAARMLATEAGITPLMWASASP